MSSGGFIQTARGMAVPYSILRDLAIAVGALINLGPYEALEIKQD